MTNRATKFYDFALTGNGSQVILAEGSFYKILSSTGTVEVQRDGGSAAGPLSAGQGERDTEFNRLTIRDKSGALNVGTLIVSDGQFIDDRIAGAVSVVGTISITGDVNVIEGGKSRSLANKANMCWMIAPAVGAQLSFVQLWNPAASGQNLIVDRISIASGVSTGFVHRSNNAPGAGVAGTPVSKLLGAGSLAVALAKNGSGAAAGVDMYLSNGPINTQVPFLPVTPIVIQPGFGYAIWGQTVNSDISASWEWFEEPV